jgi:putative ABC transport system substrate-binding protein
MTLRRREFITALGGAAAFPLAARAQQSAMPVIGLLSAQAYAASQHNLTALREGLADAGLIEGRTVSIVYRSAEGDPARLPALATELVRIPVLVIAAVGGNVATLAAKAATSNIPIVFTTASDPVGAGLVPSLNRPGGNVTGATSLGLQVVPKQIGLLRDMVPKLSIIWFMTSPTVPMFAEGIRDFQKAAQAVGLKAVVANVTRETEIDAAFGQLSGEQVDALVVSSGAFFVRFRDRLLAPAARYRIPVIFANREFPESGGLMSYGADINDAYRQVGLYVGRILRGDKPAYLPVVQPTRFQFIINMKTVKALGLTVPPGLFAIADEIIE